MPHVYFMQGELQTELFKDKRLKKDSKLSYYKIVTINTSHNFSMENGIAKKEVVADGVYLIVVLANDMRTAYIRRHPENATLRTGREHNPERGHSSIARGKPVVFAGELFFSNGLLTRWNCRTGHYLFGSHLVSYQIRSEAEKATQYLRCDDGSLLLPLHLFSSVMDI